MGIKTLHYSKQCNENTHNTFILYITLNNVCYMQIFAINKKLKY